MKTQKAEVLNKYVSNKEKKELEKQKKLENRKVTRRQLKEEAQQILSSKVVEELQGDVKEKQKKKVKENMKLRGGGLVIPRKIDGKYLDTLLHKSAESSISKKKPTNSDEELDELMDDVKI